MFCKSVYLVVFGFVPVDLASCFRSICCFGLLLLLLLLSWLLFWVVSYVMLVVCFDCAGFVIVVAGLFCLMCDVVFNGCSCSGLFLLLVLIVFSVVLVVHLYYSGLCWLLWLLGVCFG